MEPGSRPAQTRSNQEQRKFRREAFLATLALVTVALTASADDQTKANVPPANVLLIDNLGRVVNVPTNELHRSLLPPSDLGLKHQTPDPIQGMKVPEEILQRKTAAGNGAGSLQFFPAVAPRLKPYLASLDEYGNTTLRPGALVPLSPLDPIVQGGKYWLAEQGLRYSLEQSFTGVGMSDVVQGDKTLGFYTFDLKAKWAIWEAPRSGTAGWLSAQLEAKTGLGSAGQTQSAKSNLGTVTDPTDLWSSVNGFRLPELAWQQSLRDGEVMVVAGLISQRNYLDGNAAAHTGRGEFMNSALIHSQVLPLAEYNFGVNLQWQPVSEWYVMLGSSVGAAPAGHAPWTDFSWQHWSVVGELGYAPNNFLGLGPGVYRVQPFVAEAGGPTQAGLGFNLQQHLGPHSPFAWFGRFGFGGSEVSAGTDRQVGTGFVLQAPLKQLGLVPRLNNDLLGVGLVWSQPAATTKTVYHENEYIAETFYTLQLTPTMKLQADFQMVWDAAFNPDAGPATVFQLQLNLAW